MARYTAQQALQHILNNDDETDSSSSSSSSEATSDDDHLSVESSSDVSSDVGENDESTILSTSTATQTQRQRVRGRGMQRGSRRGVQRGRTRSENNVVRQIPTSTFSDQSTVMTSKSGKQWSTKHAVPHRRGLQDIIRNPPGVRRDGIVSTELQAFRLFVTAEMLDLIVRETNREAERQIEMWNNSHPGHHKEWKVLTLDELEAVIGLLLIAGVYRGRLEPLEDLWSNETGRTIFAAVMSLKRFKQILRHLRFDNKATREQRRSVDKLAAFRDIWEMFVSQLHKYYIPGTDLTVDEQLVAYRGKCPFRQYIPSKPAKYGIKIWWACDSATSFPMSGEVYLGRQPGHDREKGLGAAVVKRLTKFWMKSGRNIVIDNYFTSVPLAEDLLQMNTTLVGTIRKNKPDIPKEMIDTRGKEEKSSTFGFSDDLTLVSYIPKKGKVVTMLSTMHHDSITEGEDRKPQIILHYNSCKGGVDTMDKMATTYTCRRKTNRWPMALFFNMLDIGAIAAFIIWFSCQPTNETKKTRLRRSFLYRLGRQLTENHIKQRLQCPQALQKGAKQSLIRLGYCEPRKVDEKSRMQPMRKKRCYLCPRTDDRKVKQVCTVCTQNVCKDHSKPSVSCDNCM